MYPSRLYQTSSLSSNPCRRRRHPRRRRHYGLGLFLGLVMIAALGFLAGGATTTTNNSTMTTTTTTKPITLSGSLPGVGSTLRTLAEQEATETETTTTTSHHGTVQEEEEEEEEKGPTGLKFEDELSLTDLRVIISITLTLILLTVAFEMIKERLEESVPEDYEIILEKFFGELTILGFLSMLTFLLSKTGLLEKLSEHLFEEQDELLEYVEFVHFALFFIMISFVIQVLGMIREAEEQEKEWAKIDETIRHQPAHDAPTLADEQVLTTWQRRHWYTLICTRFWSSDAVIQSREETVFKGLRREFILDRALDEPFAPKDAAKRLKHSFNFGRYLGLAQIHILSHAVEVQKQTWFFFGVTAIAFYGIAVAAHERVMALGWVWVACGWAVYLGNFFFVAHLLSLRNSYLPNPEAAQAGEGTNLVSNGASSHQDTGVMPRWCFFDLDKYMENRPWLIQCLVKGMPNRQQAHFWMDRHGPKYFTFLLQVNLIFAGIYAGLLLLEFIPFTYHEEPLSIFVLYTVLSVLPLFGILYNKRDIVALMTQVTSIGTYRKDQIVRDVLLEESTTRIVRTFLIIQRLRRVAERGQPEHGDSLMTPNRTSFSELEKAEVGHTFDAFDSDKSGSITKREFHELLARLGAKMEDHQFDLLVKSLDTDGDGYVTRDEFISWYQYQSEHDDITLHERAEDLFDMFDENKSGEITLGEFKTKLDALNMGFTTDEIGAILHVLDHDRSGSVSLEEVVELLHKFYPEELGRRSRSNHHHHH